jgi:hypothetical protein
MLTVSGVGSGLKKNCTQGQTVSYSLVAGLQLNEVYGTHELKVNDDGN